MTSQDNCVLGLSIPTCPKPPRSYVKKLSITLPADFLELLDKTILERGEKNRSELIKYLLTCWIYSPNGECDPKCPNYEGDEEA